MKSNLVKIIGTLGLIIAIAVILKSVFGIGKKEIPHFCDLFLGTKYVYSFYDC